MGRIKLYTFGQKGVNVDASDLHVDDSELRMAQNAILDPLRGKGALRSRPGLGHFNSVAAAGIILGGKETPLENLLSGDSFLYIGRGSTT